MSWTQETLDAWEETLDAETMNELLELHGDGPFAWILEECDRVVNEGRYLDRAGQPNFVKIALVVGKRLGYRRDDYRVLDCLFQYTVDTWHRYYPGGVFHGA